MVCILQVSHAFCLGVHSHTLAPAFREMVSLSSGVSSCTSIHVAWMTTDWRRGSGDRTPSVRECSLVRDVCQCVSPGICVCVIQPVVLCNGRKHLLALKNERVPSSCIPWGRVGCAHEIRVPN